ncbi:MAG: sirohydrochlorin chelatase [Pirellulales bacterium]|nr:sirohydrochlorin chelatase [Pirellulales bacterium]
MLIGHGTRQQAGLAEFFEVVGQIRAAAAEFPVESCFLEIAEPDIATGVRRLLERSVQRIVACPLLLFAAGHAKRDIPAAIQAAIQGNDCAAIQHVPPLECQPEIIELSEQRFAEAICKRPEFTLENTLLLLVGRGNSDPTAIAQMHRFAALRAQRSQLGKVVVSFVAMAEPSLEAGLQLAAESRFEHIVVQPHLLFAGQILAQITKAVAGQARRQTDRLLTVTPHLGPSPLVAQAVIGLCRQCGLRIDSD